jgi:hypothetical protein
MLCLPYYAYVFSSTNIEIRAKQFLSGSKGVGEEREGVGEGGRNDPNICTYE